MAGLGPCVFARPARPPLGWVSYMYEGTVARLSGAALMGGAYLYMNSLLSELVVSRRQFTPHHRKNFTLLARARIEPTVKAP